MQRHDLGQSQRREWVGFLFPHPETNGGRREAALPNIRAACGMATNPQGSSAWQDLPIGSDQVPLETEQLVFHTYSPTV